MPGEAATTSGIALTAEADIPWRTASMRVGPLRGSPTVGAKVISARSDGFPSSSTIQPSPGASDVRSGFSVQLSKVKYVAHQSRQKIPSVVPTPLLLSRFQPRP